mgnify:CR=1 FL=1
MLKFLRRLLPPTLIFSGALTLLAAGSVIIGHSRAAYCFEVIPNAPAIQDRYRVDVERGRWQRLPPVLSDVLYAEIPAPDTSATARLVITDGRILSLVVDPTAPDGNAAQRVVQRGMVNTYQAPTTLIDWRADSRALAYLWLDTELNVNLSTYDLDTQIGQTLTGIGTGTLEGSFEWTLAGWSGDGAYVAVNSAAASGRQITFYHADPLAALPAPLTFSAYITGAWSPSRAEFAAYTLDTFGSPVLTIRSMDSAAPINLQPSPPVAQNHIVSWSPSGDEFMVGGTMNDCDNCPIYWRFDLFRRDGTPLAVGVRGISWNFFATTGWIPGAWSDERWYWMTGDPAFGIAAIDLATGATQMIVPQLDARHIVNALGLSRVMQPTLHLLPADRWLLAVLEDGLPAVALLDLTTNSLHPVVENAYDVLLINMGETPFLRDYGAIYWTRDTGSQLEDNLTIVRFDDLSQFTVPITGQIVSDLVWSDADHLSYMVQRPDGGQHLEAVYARTGERARLTDVVNVGWSLSFSPTDDRIAALYAYVASGYTSGTFGVLHIGAAEMMPVAEFIDVPPHWSPDGAWVAALGQIVPRALYIASSGGDQTIYRHTLPTELPAIVQVTPGGFVDCAP